MSLLPERGGAPLDSSLATQDLVARLCRALPEPLVVAGWLYYVDGLDQTEIAEICGVSRRTIVTRVSEFRERAQAFVKEAEHVYTADAAGDAALPRHLSSFHLEALRLGAASDLERARMETHLAGCGRCQDALAASRGSLQEFEAGALGRTRASDGTRGVRAASASRRRWISGGVGVLAAAAAVLVIWRGPAHPRNSGIAAVEPAVGIKGGLDLVVPSAAGTASSVPTQSRCGSAIRFALRSTGSRHRLDIC